ALLGGCDVLVMPSPYESLSVIVLEAWAMGRPVLVNSACRVLEGQCVRSGGGLFYRGYSEFAEALRRLLDDAALRAALGEAGRARRAPGTQGGDAPARGLGHDGTRGRREDGQRIFGEGPGARDGLQDGGRVAVHARRDPLHRAQLVEGGRMPRRQLHQRL